MTKVDNKVVFIQQLCTFNMLLHRQLDWCMGLNYLSLPIHLSA